MTPKQIQHLEDNGGSPGVVIRYQKGAQKPEKIQPTALSQGHAQLAQEHRQDLKNTVGINTETLAIENDQSSGRAIGLRIKQGLVQVHGLFDNLARTKRQIGKFIIAMFPEIFDVAKLKRVLGEQFLQERFQKPVLVPATDAAGAPLADASGQPMMVPKVDPNSGQPAMEYDDAAATQLLTKVIQDAEIGVYDIAIGEVMAAATTMFGQFQEALELREKGIMVPDDVLIESSSLSESQKRKSLAYQAQAAAAASKKAA